MKRAHLLILTILAVAGPALAASDISVIQKDESFSTPSITIHVGDTVLWGNADDFTHNISVHNLDGSLTDLGVQAHGQVIRHTFDAAGSYRVVCKVHPKMKMTVVVN